MNSERKRRQQRRRPNFSQLPNDVLKHIASFLPHEGIKPAKGTITSNYYDINGMQPSFSPNRYNGLRYKLVNSPSRPLTERTKSEFRKTVRNAGLGNRQRKEIARTSGSLANMVFLNKLLSQNPQLTVRKFPYIDGVYTNFNIEPFMDRGKGGTRNNFMRTSKSTRAVLRPGKKKPKKKVHQ